MIDKPRAACCHECKQPLIDVDFYGEHLKGCPDLQHLVDNWRRQKEAA